jgi:acyl dehydratase
VSFATLDLDQAPSVVKETLKAFVSRKSATADGDVGLEGWLRGIAFNERQVSGYADLCGFTPSDRVPLTYPQVLALPLHLATGNDPRFPYRLPGMVHVGNTFEQSADLTIGDVVDLRAWTQGSRQTKLGTEADLHTECHRDGLVVWRSTASIVFKRAPKQRGASKASAEPEATPWETIGDPWQVPADQGRRYAGVSGDYNPIHLYGWSAKLFGFKRPVVHGMWTLARAVAALTGRAGATPLRTLDVQFRSPLYLPSSAQFAIRPAAASAVEFRLLDERSGKPILLGSANSAQAHPATSR